MATYEELHDLSASALDPVRKRIRTAICVKAQAIAINSQATTLQKNWSLQALTSPVTYESIILNYLLAANKSATTAQIISVNDATVQAAVDSAVDTLLGV